jgi:hypothetical protein
MTTRYLGTGKNFGNQRLIAVADPQAETDAINLQSARRLVAGVTSRKEAVRVAATSNITLATPGAAIDGVTLSNGDRVLLTAQSTGSQNGIYDFNGAATAMTRSADADSNDEVKPGTSVFVSEGGANGNSSWQLTTDGPITLGSTSLTFAQIGSGGTTYTAGNGLTLTGSSFAVTPATNGGIAVGAGGVSVTAAGGLTTGATGVVIASSAAGAGLTLTTGVLAVGAGTGVTVAADTVGIDTAVVVRKFAQAIGNGAATSIAVTHNLGTRDITFSVYDATAFEFVEVDGVATDTNTLTLTFAQAPASNAYRVVVHG